MKGEKSSCTDYRIYSATKLHETWYPSVLYHRDTELTGNMYWSSEIKGQGLGVKEI